jgi:hypothetical protein
LRTTFPAVAGEPQQRIAAFTEVPIEKVDLSNKEAREEKAREWAVEEAQRPFDLGEGPLMRVKLLRLGEQDHVLLVTMHHIVSDGWSLGVLVREFAGLYRAYVEGKESPLEELKVQYVDYAQWQRERLSGEVLEEQLGYWREELAGVPVLELPTDYRRPGAASGRGEWVKVVIGGELRRQLEELSRREGVTLFMTLLAGFQALLGRYSQQQDVAVGADIANRTRLETEPLIGFFVNFLVLRSRWGKEEKFRELLRQVRGRVLGAYAHQDLPFERLVEELAPERMLGRTPLFQALLVLHNLPEERLQLPGLELRGWESGETTAKVDLMLSLVEREGRIEGSLVYAAELFERSGMERMVGHWVRLLEGAVRRPEWGIREAAGGGGVEPDGR